MQIKEINVTEIKEYAKNAKKHSVDQVKAIANSIQKFGFRQPIVLDRNMEIIIGHGRFEAAKQLGMQTVPCVMADDLTDEQVKALRIADNKTNESDWDFDILGEELGEILDFDMTDFGFSERDILELTIDDSPEADIPKGDAATPADVDYSGYTPAMMPPVAPQGGEPAQMVGGAEYGRITKEELEAYEQNANRLVTKRVIIIYRNDEEENYLKRILGVPTNEQIPVVLQADRIVKHDENTD